MKRFLCALVLVTVTSRGIAGPRVEADPNKLYPITPDVGPWVVSAASYTGPNAHELAHEVILQLRRRDNMPAYFFDFSEEEQKQLQNYPGVRPGRKIRIQPQCGVLIGGYPDADSARKMLTEVKKLKFPDLDNKTFDSIVNPADARIYYISPFANAFVTRNPTVAHEQQNQADAAVLKRMNEGEEFSLLKNKHPWSLGIKTYCGVSAVNSTTGSSSFLSKLWFKNKDGEVLNASAAQAHELARVLRSLGMEAWVLHMPKQSLVTIGGFDGPDDPRMKETAAKVHAWRENNMRRLGTDPFQIATDLLPIPAPKS